MPNILALTDKETGERHEGRGLIEVDEKLCKALGVPCDDHSFYKGWVDWGPLYMSDTWEKVREDITKYGYSEPETKLQVIDWLAAHYELGSYAIIGRR